ncbi:MAG: 4Fe-4S binding protein [Anaerolineae bacterium]|jgi:MinD superfamily P-loop ATPase|nr:4Fe-4S binding protein [Anaerolineae bacterium]MBT7189880.1 4Fe-4S binding protein [Anaerolineae bacterium]MBT7991680.1 4Fe-4S binding protein [Anaerolineae bacterium]
MRQLVVLSGKGGTGKTSVTAAFAHLASEGEYADKFIVADADVDAANLELVLQPQLLEEQEFKGGQVAVINQDTCAFCGECQDVCRFDAIDYTDGLYAVDPIACDGCAACVYQCSTESIAMYEQVVGKFYVSNGRYSPLYHANLYPGQDNSGKLVTLVKQRARLQALDEDRVFVIVDGPPGIGCPVISATSGADLVLIVAEPTISGVHDMHRVLQTVQHFGVQAIVCINKADVYPDGADEIESFCEVNGIQTVGRIPFDLTVTSAMVEGEPVTAFHPEAPASMAISTIWAEVLESLLEGEV